jgi:uncharacterized protein YjbI with pentapeptide repeats
MSRSLLSKLRQVDPYDFEYLIADLWEQMGYQTEVVQQSQDKGIDIRATNALGEKYLIQAKRHGPESLVRAPKVREYAGLYAQEDGINKVYIVTTGGFTSQAIETADETGVELVYGEQLTKLINQHEKDTLLDLYCSDIQSGNTEKKVEANESYPIPNDSTVTLADIAPNANLSDADLSEATLSGADLSDADLSDADFSDADLSDADFSDADLSDADLSDADLSDADFSDANLSGADLSEANLSGVNLCHVDLSDMDLSGTNLSDADLSDADLSDTNLSNAKISAKYLRCADFSGADLSGADLSNTDFTDADQTRRAHV